MRYALFACLLLLMACNGRSGRVSALFPQDSGYLRKKEVLNFLAFNHLTDSTAKIWRNYHDTDTFGKYYRQPDGNIIACLLDLGSDLYQVLQVMEVDPYDTILKVEPYLHWNYACCWDGFDGFTKTGNYYFLKICGTGSGYCATHLYAFQYVTPQDSLNSILEGVRSRELFGVVRGLAGIRQVRGDTLWMHYTLTKGIEEDTILTSIDTVRFTVTYVNNHKRWRALDSTFLNNDIPN